MTEQASTSASLHIGIDARELAGTPTGVGRYLAGVLEQWSRTGFPHRITLFLHAAPPSWITDLALNPAVVLAPAEVAGTWWEQRQLPRLAAAAGIDVLLAPAYTIPLRLRCPSVVVIHDVSYFAQRGGFRWKEGLRRRLLTRASAERAAAIVTVSEFSAREISRFLGIPSSSIILAPQGAPAWRDLAPDVTRDPVVLSVGTLFTRRHVPELLEAMALVRSKVPDARLVLIGGNKTEPRIDPMALARSLGIDDALTWRPYVSDEELHAYYQSASAFAFLSDYEGFAMTPMDAAAHGVPVVMLDTPVAREVYGEAARLVPLAPTAVADTLVELLTDGAARDAAVARGRARLSRFSWTTTADVLQQTLERTAQARHDRSSR